MIEKLTKGASAGQTRRDRLAQELTFLRAKETEILQTVTELPNRIATAEEEITITSRLLRANIATVVTGVRARGEQDQVVAPATQHQRPPNL